jgi:hypothetical protein
LRLILAYTDLHHFGWAQEANPPESTGDALVANLRRSWAKHLEKKARRVASAGLAGQALQWGRTQVPR